METINEMDFYSAGYFLIRAENPDWKPPFDEFLPKGNIISLSECICPKRLSVIWGWNPINREAAIEFGISPTRINEFITWCSSAYEKWMDFPSMFYSPETARMFVKEFEVDTHNLFIVGAALPKERHNVWIKKEISDEGIGKHIKQAMPIEAFGEPLGYDIISYDAINFLHSWLCSGLKREMNDLFDIRANSKGLIDTYAEAQKINGWIAEDEGRGTRAEPEPYDFWLLVSYSLNA